MTTANTTGSNNTNSTMEIWNRRNGTQQGGVPQDFWIQQGYPTFDAWRRVSFSHPWKTWYSWNQHPQRLYQLAQNIPPEISRHHFSQNLGNHKNTDNHNNGDDDALCRREFQHHHHHHSNEKETDETGVSHDFWTQQGHRSFDEWMKASRSKWRNSYSWNQKKHQQMQHEWEEIVTISQDLSEFHGSQESAGIVDVSQDFWTQQGYASFDEWMKASRTKWRSSYSWNQRKCEQMQKEWEEVVRISQELCEFRGSNKVGSVAAVSQDFWTQQGYPTFNEWIKASLSKWKFSYSWNQRKRQRIQKEWEEVVHISQDLCEFLYWLRIRRNQWRVHRRKRQRGGRRLEIEPVQQPPVTSETDHGNTGPECETISSGEVASRKRRKVQLAPVSTEIATIDVILEQEDIERQRKLAEKRERADITFIFDASKGAPDDVVVHCLEFLEPREYARLLCISKTLSSKLKTRDNVWRQLCPLGWKLPRRPRKPWYQLYFHLLQIELQNSQKRWDDLLAKCSGVLAKGDHLQKIEKLVRKGEDDFGFHINYVSPVVCERNSLLNLAVIHQRHKVVRWLVDHKGADIESYDRGHFTALLNAAWAGDRQLVRFFLQRGADRTKIGYGHYSKALAAPDFKGLTAEGWALKRGHAEIAKLIGLGL